MSSQYIKFRSKQYQDYPENVILRGVEVNNGAQINLYTIKIQIEYFLSEDNVRWFSHTKNISFDTSEQTTQAEKQTLFLQQLQGIENDYMVG